MRLVITGASGFLGQAMVSFLKASHDITVLGRDLERLQEIFPQIKRVDWNQMDALDAADYDAIIHLSGLNIAKSRWSETIKQELIESRVGTTRKLINWLKNQKSKPHLYCANAVGIYGLQNPADPALLDEYSSIDLDKSTDFLAKIGAEWHNAAATASQFGIPLTFLRFGVVLKRHQGFLQEMAPVFNLGLGAIMGDGRQVLSWISIHDLLRALLFLLERPQLVGPFNLTSPNPVTQAIFAQNLAKIMHRPCFLRLPKFLIQSIFGELGKELILSGQRVMPRRLLEEGFEFLYADIESALALEFGV